MKKIIELGVNIDHVATVRQARGTRYPDPVYAAQIAEEAGADGITLHLREDRRHIQERDVRILKEILQTRMNLEIAATPAMLQFACEIAPEHVCLVPERREELTTEGGLDVARQGTLMTEAVQKLQEAGAQVSLFIDPEPVQIDAALACGAQVIELHTGHYAEATTERRREKEYQKIVHAADYATQAGLQVNAGHGLNRHNVQVIAAILPIVELNIGHALIADALFCGFAKAVREMKALMLAARA